MHQIAGYSITINKFGELLKDYLLAEELVQLNFVTIYNNQFHNYEHYNKQNIQILKNYFKEIRKFEEVSWKS